MRYAVLDFWERAALAFRGDGTRQAWDTGTSPPLRRRHHRDAAGRRGAVVDDERRARIKRFNATLVNYLFLLYFDTRAGNGDTGPTRCPTAGRSLLVRDFYRLAQSDFWWSDVAARRAVPPPHRRPRARRRAITVHRLRDVRTTRPRTTSTGWSASALHHRRRPTAAATGPLDELDDIVAAVRQAQARTTATSRR